jgi:cytochrome b subunit of formate dehydrogenase
MSLLIRIPMKIGKLNFSTAVSAFIATIISGSAFVACLFLFTGAVTKSLVAYIPIVFFTALINAVIVQLLYLPLKAVLKK